MQSVVETIIEASERIQNQEEAIESLNTQIADDNSNFDDIYDAIVDKGQHPTKADRSTYAGAIEAIDVAGEYQTKSVTPTTSAQVITPDQGYDALDEVDVAAVTSAIDQNIQAGNIKNGVSILGVTGNYSGGNLQTKQVDGKVTTNLSPEYDTYTPDSGYDGFDQVQVKRVRMQSEMYMIPSGSEQSYDYSSDLVYAGARKVRVAGDANLVTGNIKNGVTIFGVQGTLVPNLQTKNITPTTSAQQITPDSGYDGLAEVDIAAVNAAIDSNITAGNIKKDVHILGVTGTYEGSSSEIYSTVENVGTEPTNAFEATLVQYKDKLCAVSRSAVWEYDVDNKTFTQLFTGSDILKNDYRAAYKSVMVGNRLYYFDGTAIYYFDFDTQTRSTLVNGSGTFGSNLACMTSDGTNIYLADGSTSKIWKIDISTATITALAENVTRIPSQMVYRRGYIYCVRGDYVDKIDITDGTITPVLNTSTSTTIQIYTSLVADSDYIYAIGGGGHTTTILKIASDNTYETVTISKDFRQCTPCIYKGGLYCLNENEFYRDRTFSKLGEGLNKDFIVGGTDVGDIDTSNIKRITVI